MRLSPQAKAELIGDAHVSGGGLLFAIGAGLAHPPLGPIAFGGFVLWLGLFWRVKR